MAVKQQASECWKITRIPGEPEHKATTVNVYAAKIDPKAANTLIRELNARAPLPLLGHVKRVQRSMTAGTLELSIILCTADGLGFGGDIQLPIPISEIVKRYGLELFMASVAEQPAISREEWEMQCKLWPTSYHPNSGKSLAEMELSQADTDNMCHFMGIAVEEARLAHQLGLYANGAIIVDPSMGTIIARGHDATSAWCPCASCGAPDLPLQYTEEKPEATLSDQWHPLQHAVMKAIELVAERDKQLWPTEDVKATEGILNGGDLSQAGSHKRQRSLENTPMHPTTNNSDDFVLPKDYKVTGENSTLEILRPYLCTNFDLYVTREPCAMCAMAMVHQRIRKVIYGIPNAKVGALGSRYKLHGLPSLNHHYTVFQVSLSEEDLWRIEDSQV